LTSKFVFLVVVALCLWVFPARAYGYLDPATGSMVLQVLVGGLLAVAAVLRMYWKKTRSLFSRKAESRAHADE
jgi:apolipoprotein N-acyltransferase